MDSYMPSVPSFDLEELDGFDMFSAGPHHSHQNNNNQLLHHDSETETANDQQQQNSGAKTDPLDALFSSPVRDYLAREDTPDRSVASCSSSSSGFFARCERRGFSGADGRDDSLAIVARHLLSEEGNGDEESNPNLKLFAGLKDDADFEDVPDLMDSEEPSLGPNASTTPSFPPPCYSPIPRHVPSAPLSSLPRPSAPPPVAPRPFASPSLARPEPRTARKVSPEAATTTTSRNNDFKGVKKLRRGQVGSRSSSSLGDEITEVRDTDVLFGKGGKINKFPGNLRYHAQKKELQAEYLDASTSKQTKRDLVQKLYHIVVHDWGGRFLRRANEAGNVDDGEEEVWLEAHKDAALEKCRQALATPERSREERAARRRMFIEKRKRRQTA